MTASSSASCARSGPGRPECLTAPRGPAPEEVSLLARDGVCGWRQFRGCEVWVGRGRSQMQRRWKCRWWRATVGVGGDSSAVPCALCPVPLCRCALCRCAVAPTARRGPSRACNRRRGERRSCSRLSRSAPDPANIWRAPRPRPRRLQPAASSRLHPAGGGPAVVVGFVGALATSVEASDRRPAIRRRRAARDQPKRTAMSASSSDSTSLAASSPDIWRAAENSALRSTRDEMRPSMSSTSAAVVPER